MNLMDIEQECIRRERFHNLVSSGLLNPRDYYDDIGRVAHVYEVDANRRAKDHLRMLKKAVRQVAETTTVPIKRQEMGGVVRYALSREARRLWHAMRGIGLAPKAWGREREMHPHLALGMRMARKWEPKLRYFKNTSDELLVNEEYPRRILTHVVKVIRRVGCSPKVISRIQRLTRQRSDNLEECCKYVLAILRVHARPLVLRVDLYVEAEAKEAAKEGKIKRALRKLARNLGEDRIVPDVLGYIIKLENGYDRGIHLHVMVILDGDKHFQSYKLAEQLRMYWIHECVGSPQFASGFNCYLRKDEYPFNCIGHVHYLDGNALRGVLEALKYVTKTDMEFLLPKSLGKSLRKGQVPPVPLDGKRRGAPRKNGDDVALAEGILLGWKAEQRSARKGSRRTPQRV
ncbi:hypothetical protein ACFWZ1_09605 [Frateuria sp. GZRe14]|uniref:hypothetical protein n=1 Tax=Frateuria sp. GZRe14 TaxID=3351534 RepID=UPI003EDC6D61